MSSRSSFVNNKPVLLHRFLMNAPKGIIVDHKDRDICNMRKSNLRFSTKAENARNRRIQSNNTTGVTGVIWWHYNGLERWHANINVDGKNIKLGYHRKFEDAVKARKAAEVKYFGEFRPDD